MEIIGCLWHLVVHIRKRKEQVGSMKYTVEQLEEKVRSENWAERMIAAENGYGLDVLVEDKDERVRAAVARQGYCLAKLVRDKHWWVRVEVANMGYGLEKLVEDEDSYVRAAVARQGYGLDRLVNDEAWVVREAVAECGSALELLMDDKNDGVRFSAEERLEADGVDVQRLRRRKRFCKDAKTAGKVVACVGALVGVVGTGVVVWRKCNRLRSKRG